MVPRIAVVLLYAYLVSKKDRGEVRRRDIGHLEMASSSEGVSQLFSQLVLALPNVPNVVKTTSERRPLYLCKQRGIKNIAGVDCRKFRKVYVLMYLCETEWRGLQ